MIPIPEFAWLDGNTVPWQECRLHARSQGAFWGANIFEGVRAYWDEASATANMFRLNDHLARLRRSAKCLQMELNFSDDELIHACVELLRRNRIAADSHLVIAASCGMGINADPMNLTQDVLMHITCLRMPRSPLFECGLTTSISSWRRISDDTVPPRIKCGANYYNSRLAHQEAVRAGFDTAIFLNRRGTIAEAPGACVVIVQEGRLITPPGTSGVLEGITLATVAKLASEQGTAFDRREIDRTELYLADEAFLCGTLCEIQPIIRVDHVPVGSGTPGRITRSLQNSFDRRVHGSTDSQWCTPVHIGKESLSALR
jgi:branched-chain amino acid aminotransferase